MRKSMNRPGLLFIFNLTYN
jgi:hypothetical protein